MQIPGHLVRDVVALVALRAVHQVVAGGEPVAVKDHDHIRLGRGNFLAQPGVAGDEVRVGARAHQHAKLLALHQAGVV